MTSGFGVDASANGSTGTTSLDIRRILGAQYTPGVLEGCEITTSASAMTYTISRGVVAIPTGTGEIVLAPVDQTTLTTSSAPVSGSPREDIIYVQQRFPSIQGDANVIVGITTVGVMPANAVQIGSYLVPVGATNTNSATVYWPRTYATAKNNSLGLLHYWQNTYSGTLSTALIREGHGEFTLPTDRRLTFKVRAVLNAAGASGFDNSKYCEWGFLFGLDAGDFVLHCTPGLHQAWATYEFSTQVEVSAGFHTVNLGSKRIVGPGVAETHYGIDGAGFGRRGVEFSVYDDGPVQSAFDVSPSF